MSLTRRLTATIASDRQALLEVEEDIALVQIELEEAGSKCALACAEAISYCYKGGTDGSIQEEHVRSMRISEEFRKDLRETLKDLTTQRQSIARIIEVNEQRILNTLKSKHPHA